MVFDSEISRIQADFNMIRLLIGRRKTNGPWKKIYRLVTSKFPVQNYLKNHKRLRKKSAKFHT